MMKKENKLFKSKKFHLENDFLSHLMEETTYQVRFQSELKNFFLDISSSKIKYKD
jgi:hypothetical protein